MNGPRSLATLLQPITRQALGKQSAALGALFSDWPAIIGEEVARRAVPERLSLPGPRQETGILTLRVDSADALELQHDAPRLIERINAYYGYRAIARITLIQAPLRHPSPPTRRRALAPSEQAELEAVLAGIEDDGLRARLAALGSALYSCGPAR